ncbi:MAG: hypothetical protein OXH86_19970 [Acidimicrobiaceae bacterium]|nr:hypothetical protein [Acidimicrobiaceae bacterium]MDE0499622.1 hypothetical protein [Acidimicrobiaceae bacterium]
MTADRPVKAQQAAERLGVDKYDIYCMIEWGEIVGGPDPDRDVAVPEVEIDRVIAAGGAPNYIEVYRKYGKHEDIPEHERERLTAMHEKLAASALASINAEGASTV